MPLAELQEIRTVGLFTHPNRLQLPRGALIRAENCVVSRDGIVSPRRGFARYGDELSEPASALGSYQGRLLVLDGTSLKYDSDGSGTWVAFSGSHSPPSGARMRFLETLGNVYFTTARGVFVIDELGGTPLRSGIPQGLDIELEAAGTGGSWLLADSQVGYVVTWRRKDAQKNPKQGSPSRQERYVNATQDATWSRASTTATITAVGHGLTTGDEVRVTATSDGTAIPTGSYTATVTGLDTFTITVPDAGAASGTLSFGEDLDLTVTFTVPPDALEGDEWELWRTPLSASAATGPGLDSQLIFRRALTAGEIATGTVTYLDENDEAFLGEPLYVNQGQETRSQSNDRPPLASFIVTFQGHTWYLKAAQPHELALQLLDISALVDSTSSITFDVGTGTLTYTAAAVEDIGAREFQRFTSFPTLAQNVAATAKSLERVINRDMTQTDLLAYYISQETDAPGKLLFQRRTLGLGAFSVTCDDDATTGTSFEPALPETGETVASEASEDANLVYRSKFNQPEAVPRFNRTVIGSKNKATLGAAALKDALLIFREDGVFVITGRSDSTAGSSFVDDILDPTVRLQAENTLVLLDNSAVSYTSQGALKMSQASPAIISRPQVESDLRRIGQYQLFSSLAHATSYESERLFILWVPERSSDRTVTIAYVYNYGTNAWTTWRKPVSAGLVLDSDDRLYLAHALDSYILQERKALDTTGNDFSDEDFDCTITAVSTGTGEDGVTVSTVDVTYSDSGTLGRGWLLLQGFRRAAIDTVEDLGGGSYRLFLRKVVTGFTAGAATLGGSYGMLIEWIEHGGSPKSLKQFPYVAVYPSRAGGTHRLGFKSDLINGPAFTGYIKHPKTYGWGNFPWGGLPWGTPSPGAIAEVRSSVSLQHQQARVLQVLYENVYARELSDILMLAVDVRMSSGKGERAPT